MAALAILAGIVAFLVSFFTLIEKLRSLKTRKDQDKAHPLEAPLREIAAALRESVNDRNRQITQLRESVAAVDEARRRWQWKNQR